MENLEETSGVIYTMTGALNFLGGSFSTEKVRNMPFGEVMEVLLRNGGGISIEVNTSRKFIKQ